MNLAQPIKDAIQASGYEVVMIEDVDLDFDWHHRWHGIKARLKLKTKAWWTKAYSRHWKKVIDSEPELKKPFDIFLCINGVSLHKCFVKYLKRVSPNIKCALYLWDNSGFYDYFHNASLFDVVKTYDIDDSIKYSAPFLPFYWTKSWQESANPKYCISCIGSNNDNRLTICRKIAQSCAESHLLKLKPCFKILDPSLQEDSVVTHTKVSIAQVQQIMNDSMVILDTDRESQSGTTPRLIWALAMGKRIATTNVNIARLSFYNPQQICIIDRNNPVIPDDFFLPYDPYPIPSEILDLRIDHWVNNFLFNQ